MIDELAAAGKAVLVISFERQKPCDGLPRSFGMGIAFGAPQPVLLMFAVFIVAGLVLGSTKFVRVAKAIGSNAEAARRIAVAMKAAVGRPVERAIASSGGAKAELWLKVKARIYNIICFYSGSAHLDIS